jgi:hypothetical protein
MEKTHLELKLMELNQLIDLAIMNGKNYQALAERRAGVALVLKKISTREKQYA